MADIKIKINAIAIPLLVLILVAFLFLTINYITLTNTSLIFCCIYTWSFWWISIDLFVLTVNILINILPNSSHRLGVLGSTILSRSHASQ